MSHAREVIKQGEALLGWVQRDGEIWIVTQLAFKLGKLHERWKVTELVRRSGNSRKGAKQANDARLRESDAAHSEIRRRFEVLTRAGMRRVAAMKRIEAEGKGSVRWIRKIVNQTNMRSSR